MLELIIAIDDFGGMIHDEEDRALCQQRFGMDIPTHVKFFIAEQDEARMRAMQADCIDKGYSAIRDHVGRVSSKHGSHIVFLRDNQEIPISQYDDFDTEFDTVDLDSFEIKYTLYGNSGFTARFIYSNGAASAGFVFNTNPFRLP